MQDWLDTWNQALLAHTSHEFSSRSLDAQRVSQRILREHLARIYQTGRTTPFEIPPRKEVVHTPHCSFIRILPP